MDLGRPLLLRWPQENKACSNWIRRKMLFVGIPPQWSTMPAITGSDIFAWVDQRQNHAEDNDMSDDNPDLPSDAIAALEQGSKIDAIKCVRIAYGVGLKESKDIVEQFIDRHPDVKQRMVSANVESAKGAFKWLFLIAAIGLAAWYFFIIKH